VDAGDSLSDPISRLRLNGIRSGLRHYSAKDLTSPGYLWAKFSLPTGERTFAGDHDRVWEAPVKPRSLPYTRKDRESPPENPKRPGIKEIKIWGLDHAFSSVVGTGAGLDRSDRRPGDNGPSRQLVGAGPPQAERARPVGDGLRYDFVCCPDHHLNAPTDTLKGQEQAQATRMPRCRCVAAALSGRGNEGFLPESHVPPSERVGRDVAGERTGETFVAKGCLCWRQLVGRQRGPELTRRRAKEKIKR
jgi:hypothetical protein